MALTELAGKVAVVTGAASGIGYAVTDRLATAGMKVVMADIEETALGAAAQRQRDAGHEVLPVPTDVSKADAIEALADAAYSQFGGCHVLHNNAGVVGHGAVWTLTQDDSGEAVTPWGPDAVTMR